MKSYDKIYQQNSLIEDSASSSYSSILDDVYSEEKSVDSDVLESNEDEIHTGFVDNCAKAYIREAPNKESNHLTIVNKGDELLVEYLAEDWYKVTTQSGLEGYIMTDLVKLD